jgi:crotonobetainyl-CoA:carnitine CoA-transferase CaiB-like acyl-CoA transferase
VLIVRVDALNDITVIECSTFVTGPYAATLLGDLGARVIKIESPPKGDPYRYFAPDPFYSPNFAHLNRNKESLALDLKAGKAREICFGLIKKADVFVENFRPGTADRLGLDYEALKAINPRLVYCSISAFGQSGPYAQKPGFDTLGQAVSGLLSLLTDPEQPKVMGIALSDYVTGLSAGYGILGALLGRQNSGKGLWVDTSLLQATLSFIGETSAGYLRTGDVPTRFSRTRNAHAFAFLAKDGLRVAIHCSVPEKFWLGLLQAVERPELAEDERFKSREERRKNFAELESELAPVFSRRDRDDWMKRLEEHDVPAGPLYHMGEVLSDPQVKHLGLVESTDHAQAGRMEFVGPPVNLGDLPRRGANPPPLVGEHTRSILDELGYDRRTVQELEGQGVVLAHESEGP